MNYASKTVLIYLPKVANIGKERKVQGHACTHAPNPKRIMAN